MRKPADGARFSACGALVLGFVATAILVGGVLGWSVFSSISGAVIAAGRVAVENHNQVVEHIDGGTVSEVYVRDGARVARGDVLLRFDDAQLRSEEAVLAGQYAELTARRNRLEAEMRGADAIAWDGKLAALAANDRTVRDILAGQERLFQARASARADEVARLRHRIGQARDEIAGLKAQALSLKEQGTLIAREFKAQTELFEKGLTRLSRVLALERAAKNLEGQSGTNAAAIARIRGRIAELEIQVLQIDSRRTEKAAERARDIGSQENQAKERLASVRKRLGRMEVRAPVAGEVFGMTVSAPREVVGPGEPILQIVPQDAGLVVMARLNPIDVDQVHPGQAAILRFSAFPARETPEFEGRVLRVSADVARDEVTGLSWYQVELAVNRKAGNPPGPRGRPADARRRIGDLPVVPGMPVEAHIRTEERSVASYLVKPVANFFAHALREQ